MKLMNKLNLSLKTKKSLIGYIFISPFLIGFALFFLYPFFQSVMFSLSKLKMGSDGFMLSFVGLENYYHILRVDPDFVEVFITAMVRTVVDIPLIIAFSFFAAVLLNQKFRGRLLARSIFFLPVILTAGVLERIRGVDYLLEAMGEGGMGGEVAAGGLFAGTAMRLFLLELRFPEVFVRYIIGMADHIPELINASAIPILIFLAGLQSLPKSLYESSKIDGATKWENFWLITFPLMSPLILTNLVYIVIDSFTSPYNPLMELIEQTIWGSGSEGYGYGAAMSWFYFIAIFIVLTVAIKIISKRVFYME